MRELQASGLVSRKKNAGTRIEALSPQRGAGGFTQALGFHRGGTGSSGSKPNVTSSGLPRWSPMMRWHGISDADPGRRWLRISSLRTIPGDATKTPICWTDVYIDDAFAREVRSRMDAHRDIFGTLVEKISGRRFSEFARTSMRSAYPLIWRSP